MIKYIQQLRTQLKNNSLLAKKLCTGYEDYVKKQKIYTAIEVARKVSYIAENELNITDNNYNIISVVTQAIKFARANKIVLITRIVKTNALVVTNLAFTKLNRTKPSA